MWVSSARLGYTLSKAVICILFIALVAQGAGRSPERPGASLAYAKLIAAADQEPIATGSLARIKAR